MIRKEPDRPSAGGRRPLLVTFVGNNRQMLNEIRDSLSHLRKNDLEGFNDLSSLQHKPELPQSTPNLLEKSAGSKMTRRDNQHDKALAEIRDSLRPYQNASNGQSNGASSGAGSAGGSDNSSTNSSTSSHAASEADSTSSKVLKIVQYGFDEDIAERALKLSGNKSVEAALHLLYQIMEERLNGGRKMTGLPRATFGPSSPAASETNSVRSDSPSLNSTQQRPPPLANGFQTPPPLPPRVPISTMTANHIPRGQTPPPVTDGVDSAMKAGSSLQQQSSGLLQLNHGQAMNQAALLQSHLLAQNNVVPHGHVQQIVKRISTGQNYYIQQQPVGGLVARGVSPNPALSAQQPIIMGGSNNGGTPSPSPLLSQQLQGMIIGTPGSSSSNSSSSASSNNGAAPTMPRGYTQAPPPPYSEAQAQIQAARFGVATITGINGGAVGHVEGLQQQDLHRLDNSIMSATSEAQQIIQKKLLASAAVSATRTPMGSNHLPVIMPSVRSKEVHKPVPQTATAPVVPASQNININGGVPQNYISQVQTHSISTIPAQQHLKVSQHMATAMPQPASAISTTRRDVRFQITHSQPMHQLPQGLRNGNNSGYTTDQLINMTGQPTIQTRHQASPFSPNHLQNIMLQTNSMYSQFTNEAIMSTPRSDSPVSRTTNQSPMSVLSTASSPSTNSDIPDKPPPPYPGRGMVNLGIGQSPQMNPPPQLPPRIPLKEKPPPPPPPEQESLSQQALSSQLPKYPPSQLSANFPLTSSSTSSSPSPSSPGTPLPGSNMPLAIMPIHSNININIQSPTEVNITSAQNCNILNLPGPQVVSSTPVSETDETDTDTSQGNISSSNNKCSSNNNAQNEKHRCMSPLPERKSEARERDRLRCDTKVKMYSPQAFKFYMEQHVENVLKSHTQRINRRLQLEKEMAKVNLSEEAAKQMRKMLHQKESNYIRLKRAKMDSSMFEKIQTLGVGAFGEVALVRKKDVGSLYAMKTLKKSNVIKRNQVAHVKAERDILAEADNEWVVKLYYSFQDGDNLYFVMDYVPGGDLMGLLIRKEILDENLAQFYIAELVLAIESVHRMGFIHRDIKPDNILIDKDGHIKLTDFGLCTGFRWTHNSKYYQKDGTHARQDSMEVSCQLDDQCRCDVIKPLERRRQREQKRCLAHSLVGTPNYIAPEVLLRLGYTKACDWWSVGVILYEMVIGQPPFYANTPAETQYKVINWKETLSFRHCTSLSPSTRDLIVQLLQGPEARLGRNGASEVKEHSFFAGINFEGLRRQAAPFKPTIRYLTDTSNFDPVDPDKLRTNDSEGCKKLDSKLENGKHPEHAFFEFTFRRFFDDGGHPCSLPSQQDQESNSPVYV